jgi:hypothetical protein
MRGSGPSRLTVRCFQPVPTNDGSFGVSFTSLSQPTTPNPAAGGRLDTSVASRPRGVLKTVGPEPSVESVYSGSKGGPSANAEAASELMWDPAVYFYHREGEVDLSVAYDGTIGFGTLTADLLASANALYNGMVCCSSGFKGLFLAVALTRCVVLILSSHVQSSQWWTGASVTPNQSRITSHHFGVAVSPSLTLSTH